MSQDAGRCSSDKVPDCRETVAFSQQLCRRNRTQIIHAMLPGGRQAASDLQGMNGKTDSDQFAAESERVSLADFSGQEHRWNCPKANRIDDTNGNRNGCMQLPFQSARACLKTIPVQQKDRRWRILRCARKNTAVQIIFVSAVFLWLYLFRFCNHIITGLLIPVLFRC